MKIQINLRRGTTLPELLIAMTVMTLIAGVISTTYFTSLQVWRRCSSQSQADPPAHMSISRMSRELKNAYQVNTISGSTITFSLPQTDANGYNVIPFQPKALVKYYLSDATGNEDRTGTNLWRKRTDGVTGAVVRSVIARNVENLTFDCDTTVDENGNTRILKIYAMSLAVIGREGRQEYHSQFEARIAFRN